MTSSKLRHRKQLKRVTIKACNSIIDGIQEKHGNSYFDGVYTLVTSHIRCYTRILHNI